MTDDVKRYFNSLMQKIVGLQSVLVTDRDGIPLIRVANEHAPELAMKPSFLSTFTMATDQSSKLGLGRNQTIICMYSNYQVVQMNKLPLIVTFIGSETCNTGHILALESQIDNYLDDVKQAVIEA
ncbi:ragulator complex protein LAMTOR3 homolog [Bradysia coprophila]|uniref:ragulator complex protein LAMTOR3 homolog n=1 Tax=Bradysia coprophila TaxID=38358 RepID=UPI00187DAF35|nr:ragulator complex protein LAMTOR3 homolog [Bradysia coprophila]